MELRTCVAGMIGIVWLALAAHADPYVVDALACSDGNAINEVSADDITGNYGSARIISEHLTRMARAPQVMEPSWRLGLQICDFTDDMCLAPGGAGGMGATASSRCWAFDRDLFSAKAFFVVLKGANLPGWAAFVFKNGDAAPCYGEWSIG